MKKLIAIGIKRKGEKGFKIKACGHKRTWFDRQINVYGDGKTDGPNIVCSDCGEILS